jgi:hypothetical protein
MSDFKELAISILEEGIKSNDRFDNDKEWLTDLCGIADLHPMQYHMILDYIYGPRNKPKEDL